MFMGWYTASVREVLSEAGTPTIYSRTSKLRKTELAVGSAACWGPVLTNKSVCSLNL